MSFYSFRKQMIVSLQATVLRDLHAEFFTKEHMKRIRLAAAKFWLESVPSGGSLDVQDLPAAPFHVIDFFDVVAAYYNKGAIDSEMAFVTFFFWLENYWTAFGDSVARFEKINDLPIYVNVRRMNESLRDVGIGLKRLQPSHAVSERMLREFFENEADECQ